jgi:hypothetical protein
MSEKFNLNQLISEMLSKIESMEQTCAEIMQELENSPK